MEQVLAAIAMDGDDDINVIEKAVEGVTVVGDELGRRYMGWVLVLLDDRVVRGSSSRRGFAGYGVGGFFERAAVVGHEAEARPKHQLLGDVSSLEQLVQHGFDRTAEV